MTSQPPLPYQQPTFPGCVDGVVNLDPPTLQCHDCGALWTDGGTRGRIGWAIVLSSGAGWGFLLHCQHPKVRRCRDCNRAHVEEHGERAS